MIFSKKLKIFNKPDNTFRKFLDVVPQTLSRKETREFLREFRLKVHRRMMSKKLDSVLDEKFVRRTNSGDVVYWQKGFTMIVKKLKTIKKEFNEAVYITIESFDTRVFPMEVVFRELTKE